jgi:hypothetical protein
MSWIFVDDYRDEAIAYASALGREPNPVQVDVLLPDEAKDRLLNQKSATDGVLMDVDLSNTEGERGSGPGLAQHIRVKQRAREIPEYPIVRFSRRDKVKKNVQGDPTSDDLFDLKIQKEEVPNNRASVQRRLAGIASVYAGLAAKSSPTAEAVEPLLGVTREQVDRWSHAGFNDRLLSALQVATHVAASAFMRGFLSPTGLLLGEEVLSFRLGVDANASGEAWIALRDRLPFRYSGLAKAEFTRWWARGLDDWWYSIAGDEPPLSTLPIIRRVEVLKAKTEVDGLAQLVMPAGSAGDKPWRACALTLEEDPLSFVPVDPGESVRLTPRDDLPAWVDPLYAALAPALRVKDDFRLNRADLQRLRHKYT